MNDADAIDPDLSGLVIQLCTRIGMIMEDLSLVTLDASGEGLEARVDQVARAIRTMSALVHAAESLVAR
jgi:hypothetical protein